MYPGNEIVSGVDRFLKGAYMTYAVSVDGEFYSENKEKQCND